MSKNKIAWKEASKAEDYGAALKYLSLIFPVTKSEKLVRALRKSPVIQHAAKDLLRASHLPMLSRDEAHVDEDLKKIAKGKPLLPVLLVRGDMALGVPLIVADGYHRICAVCYYDESAPMACRLVNL